MKKYSKGLVVLLLITMICTFTACGNEDSGQETGSDTLVVALSGEVMQLDPHIPESSSQGTVNRSLYDPLYYYTSEGAFDPALATDYKVSEDGCEWTFTLREGVKFHSGKEMTSEDVVATFQRIIDKADGITVTDFDGLIGAEAVDTYTVKLITDGPIGNFMNLLAHSTGVILNSDAIKEHGTELGTYIDGTGPYKLADFEAGDHIYLEANEDYWNEVPAIKSVQLINVKESSTRLNMILSGQAQFAVEIAAQDVEQVENSDVAKVRYDATNRVAHIGLNCNYGPFKDVKVREALNYAVDRDLITESIMGMSATAIDSVVADNVLGYVPGGYSYDIEKAKKLLAEAGYPDGFEFTLWTPDGRYLNDKDTCLTVASQLAEIGVIANVQTVDWATFLEKIRTDKDKTEMQAYFMGWECTSREAGYTLKTLFLSSVQAPEGWNTMFYSNPDVDALYEKAIRTTDLDEREAILKEAITICNRDAAWIPCYVYQQISAEQNGLEGIEILPNQEIRFGKAHF